MRWQQHLRRSNLRRFGDLHPDESGFGVRKPVPGPTLQSRDRNTVLYSYGWCHLPVIRVPAALLGHGYLTSLCSIQAASLQCAE